MRNQRREVGLGDQWNNNLISKHENSSADDHGFLYFHYKIKETLFKTEPGRESSHARTYQSLQPAEPAGKRKICFNKGGYFSYLNFVSCF